MNALSGLAKYWLDQYNRTTSCIDNERSHCWVVLFSYRTMSFDLYQPRYQAIHSSKQGTKQCPLGYGSSLNLPSWCLFVSPQDHRPPQLGIILPRTTMDIFMSSRQSMCDSSNWYMKLASSYSSTLQSPRTNTSHDHHRIASPKSLAKKWKMLLFLSGIALDTWWAWSSSTVAMVVGGSG